MPSYTNVNAGNDFLIVHVIRVKNKNLVKFQIIQFDWCKKIRRSTALNFWSIFELSLFSWHGPDHHSHLPPV